MINIVNQIFPNNFSVTGNRATWKSKGKLKLIIDKISKLWRSCLAEGSFQSVEESISGYSVLERSFGGF